MVLESLSGNRVNIKNLTVEAAKPLTLRDFQLDVSEEERSNMKSGIQMLRMGAFSQRFSRALLSYQIVFGQDDGLSQVPDDDWDMHQEAIRSDLARAERSSVSGWRYSVICESYLGLKKLFPEKLREDRDFPNNIAKAKGILDESEGLHYLALAANLKLLEPDFDTGQLLPNDRWNRIQQESEQVKRDGRMAYCKFLRDLKIVDPGKAQAIVLSNDDIRSIQAYIDQNREDGSTPDPEELVNLIADLKVFMAKEVKITEEGIQLKMPERTFDEERKLPAVRNF